jgi:trimethylamine--corrinoid protein Co-methyltransferase
LSEAQIKRLHQSTPELLETVGVNIRLPEAVDRLADAGCQIKKEGIVQFPINLACEPQ